MRPLTKVACRTLGVTGMGIALYDAVHVSKLMSKQQSEFTKQKHLEDAYFSSRTIDDVSYNQNNIRQKTFDLRSKNPLPHIWGGFKGGINGFLAGIGTHLPLVVCSAFALASKGFMAKVGMVGSICCGVYSVLRNGFGVGKKNPMC